jgi:hypothetical protein
MRLYRAIGIAAAAGALVAGCGSSSGPSSSSGASNGIANQSASQILTAAATALKSARSVMLVGSFSSNGKATQVNGTFFSTGDANATLGLNGVTSQLIKIGPTDYFKAPAAYWTAQGIAAGTAAKLDGIWVSIPDSQANIGNNLSLSAFASHATKDIGTYTKGGTTTVNGQAVITITSAKEGTVYVATVGTPYPVEVVKTGSNAGTLTFSNWNGGTEPTPPAGAKTLAQLGVGGTGGGSSGTSGASGSSGSATSST